MNHLCKDSLPTSSLADDVLHNEKLGVDDDGAKTLMQFLSSSY